MRILSVLIVHLLLVGCTAMMVGGGGGSYQQRGEARPPGVVASDAAITTKLEGKYIADPLVSAFDIGVSTWKGVVTLSGAVGSYVAREEAESIAKSTGGVKAVNNHIVVEDRSAR